MSETGKPEGAPIGWNDPFDLENYLGEDFVQAVSQPAMKPKTVMPDAAIDAMARFSEDVYWGRCVGRDEYMTAFEKIVAAGARTETPECDDCPPLDYPTDKTRCLPCPRRKVFRDLEALVKAAIAMNDAYYALLLMKAEDPTRFTGAGSPYRNLETALAAFKGA